ncbi:MAG: helix-turn-helix domain-containing protein [Oscillospiraceae bacterium]|jgi:pentatricopeptide repeat protein|nr:helix-turn-helix domain-containing protein [Oscillospiraceae bacterium]
MSIKISENLKKLRRSHDLTQEELADIVGVSAQSISKWERGDNFPDITLLPAIANFFEVTLDELVGMSEIRGEKRIADLKALTEERKTKAVSDYQRKVSFDPVIAEWRELVRDMPHNLEVQYVFAGLLSDWGLYGKAVTKEIFFGQRRESIAIYTRILENCTDDELRCKVIVALVETYISITEYDEAREFITRLPDIKQSKTYLDGKIADFAARNYFAQYRDNTEAVRKSAEPETLRTLIQPIKDAYTQYIDCANEALANYRNWLDKFGLVSGEKYVELLKLDEAMMKLRNFDVDPNNIYTAGYGLLIREYIKIGDTESALDYFEKMVESDLVHDWDEPTWGIRLFRGEDGKLGREPFAESLRMSRIRAYQQAYEQDPILSKLKSQPRWTAIMERLNEGRPDPVPEFDYNELVAARGPNVFEQKNIAQT